MTQSPPSKSNSAPTIAVGSLNPVKITAVEGAFTRMWPHCTVAGVAVPSGVSDMPMSSDECLQGARSRARAALAALNSDFGVGLEGGVNVETAGMTLLGWVAIVHRDGREGVACSARVPLPTHIAQRVAMGEELGPLMDDVLGEHNVRQKGGASGALSAGLVKRRDKFEMAVAYALAPFLSPHLYDV